MYGVDSVKQIFQIYFGTTMYLWAFFVSMVYGFCHAKEDGKKRLLFIYILSILFVFNDFSMKLAGKVTGTETYYRFIWAIPVIPFIAWAVTKAVMGQKKFWERAFILVILSVIFWNGTNRFVTEGSVRVPENIYNLPGDIIEVCDIIEENKKVENPVVAFDYESQTAARLYNPSLVWGIRRKAYQEHNDTEGYENAGKFKLEKVLIHAVNFGMQGEQELLAKALKKRKIDYIVTYTSYGMDDYFSQAGYDLVGSTGNRNVYVRRE